MDNDLLKDVESIISNHIDWFYSELNSFIIDNSLIGKLTSQCSLNKQGLIFGAVSYSPNNDPAEESIDLSITPTINFQARELDLQIDIYWSNGSHIKDLIDVSGIDFENATTQINTLIDKSKLIALSEMKELINIERPPYYSKD